MITDQAPMEEEIDGFSFHPTGDELVNHRLSRKLQKIDEERCVIPEVDIYDHDPRDLCNVCNEKKSYKRSRSCSNSFFFCPGNNMNPNSTCNRRQTGGRYRKETGQKHDVMDEKTEKMIGTNIDLAMHEYHLNAYSADNTIDNPMTYSLCHLKKKKKKNRSKIGNWKRQKSKNRNTPSRVADSNFHGEALAVSQIPQTELLSFGASDITAGARCENEGTAWSSVYDREDGLSLSDLELDLDSDVDKLIKESILDEPCDPVAEE